MKPVTILRTCAWMHARRAYLHLSAALERELKPCGLSPPQFMILADLAAHGPSPLSPLARRLGLERTTLYRTLRPLEADGLVEIIPRDRGRSRVARLRRAGQARLEQGIPAWIRFDHGTRTAFGPERWPALISTLAWLVEARGESAR